jgi:hypothetical protein
MYRRIMIVVDDKLATQAAIEEGTSLSARHGVEAVHLEPMPAYPVGLADAASSRRRDSGRAT